MTQNSFDLFTNPVLSVYLNNIRAWHGYVRFLGLLHLQENPDVVINRLFVEPRLTDCYVSANMLPSGWPETKTALEVITEYDRLVLLGDPGSGKSTLVNWLAWRLSLTVENQRIHRLGGLIPIPMVLRELRITEGITWSGLLQAFLDHDMAKPLRDSSQLEDLLNTGQALILLDGLDEIGAVKIRKDLRDAVFEGMDKYPACRWLLTSRILGYEDVRFDLKPTSQLSTTIEEELKQHPVAEVRYIVPFMDDQIEQFVRNWFALRVPVGFKAEKDAQDLIKAIQRDPATLRLARIPNLLPLMAQIHRVRALLPDGKALLYEAITEAYLQSIDKVRGILKVDDYRLDQKKRWLARVGFEMQRRRSVEIRQGFLGLSFTIREILADKADVITWIMDAMIESDYDRDEDVAEDFVTYIGRRSGLLLPRGPDQFAFMHLSFQEYFAACFLVEQVTSPEWITDGKGAPGADLKLLQDYTREAVWREVLVFLFELAAYRLAWIKMLVEKLFGMNFEFFNSDDLRLKTGIYNATMLLARLVVDPHSGFSKNMRDQALKKCIKLEIVSQQHSHSFAGIHKPEVARILFAEEPQQLPWVWDSFIDAAIEANLKHLTLDGCSGIKDIWIRRLSELPLEMLNLHGTDVSDLSPLSKLTNLKELKLGSPGVKDLSPLSNLTDLQKLFLIRTKVDDFSPLHNLTSLKLLVLQGTRVPQDILREQRLRLQNKLPDLEIFSA